MPKPVLLYAGITKDVSVIGTGDAVEIWDSESWAAELGILQDSVSGKVDSVTDERQAA